MAFDPEKLAKFRVSMRRRIETLRGRTEESLEFAIEHMMQERVDSYFKVEEGFAEVDCALKLIEEELHHTMDRSGATRLESRLEFVEDRFEELDSEARQRPRRRLRGFNFASFFRTATGGGFGEPRNEINSTAEALNALGLDQGSSMATITKAFRHRAKALHPDTRKGDRTTEPELRRIIEAYQYLKEQFSFTRTEPPDAP
jgi:hypothetical protein